MMNEDSFQAALAAYKEKFCTDSWWEGEAFKWEAVKCFQDNWNVQAEDFPAMLEKSLSKTYNLLASRNNFPGKMVLEFAQASPETMRAAFASLFDEKHDLVDRVERFKAQADKMLIECGKENQQHYQNENSISTYLWLRYPNQYYIYKYSELQSASQVFASSYKIKRGEASANLRNGFSLSDEISEKLRQDDDLRNTLIHRLTEACDSDLRMHTLTTDFVYFIRNFYEKPREIIRTPSKHKEYSPNLSVQEWAQLISDPDVFRNDSKTIMRRLLDIGGEATCTQLSEKYGESLYYYKNGSSFLAQRVAEKSHCPTEDKSDPTFRWWPILYHGEKAEAGQPGQFSWKLRDELKQALEQADLSEYPLYSNCDALASYGRKDFLSDVYLSSEDYDVLVSLLKYKKNVILQGAPGVGKTYAAKRLAYSMMGCEDSSKVQFVQFHQNYAYEDFVMGYRPTETGFRLTEGVFYQFCKKAEADADHDYFFIIDEINRGNMSKIFGELLLLIEKDYRGTPATLAYNRELFSVPNNLYIIGMMNTADKSLALIDYALRRRFSFFDMTPAFDTRGFAAYQEKLHDEAFDALINCIRDLNREIRNDPSLGDGFCIGHSYFCNQTSVSEDWMKSIVLYDILPTLREYWFEDPGKVDRWSGKLSGVFE